MTNVQAPAPRVLQRIDQFVGRTTNWMYEHLRHLSRHTPIVLCDALANRDEFPLIEARRRENEALSHRVWTRLFGDRPHPADARWMRKVGFSALHSHFGYVGIADFGLQEFLGVPWLVSFYGADVYEIRRTPDWEKNYARLFARIDRALALGPRMAEGLEELGCPKSKIVVHPLGVDVDGIRSCERVLEPGKPIEILYAGTFREKKGVEYLIRGAAEARRRGVRLNVTLVGAAGGKAGDEETQAAIFREIDRLDMRDVTRHRTYLPYEDLMVHALSAHVFCAPSVTSASGDAEGTPFVLQQMMATGIPVIATLHSDIPFIFGGLENQLVPERDSQAIANRLELYWNQPERVTTDGAAMRNRIASRFNVRTCAVALSDIYDNAALG